MSPNLRTRWFIRLLAVWAVLLAALALAGLLLLTQTVELYSNQFNNQALVWLIFIFQTVFAVVFAACAYGLWQFQKWGRVLFLWTSTLWFGVNLLALFVPGILYTSGGQYTTTQLILNSIRYIISLFIPVWYLNLPYVKEIFIHSPENFATED